MPADWILECSECGTTREPAGLPTVCECGRPWLVRYPERRPTREARDRAASVGARGMWRWRAVLPIGPDEEPVTLGEGDTPELPVKRAGDYLGCPRLSIKDEAVNPTGSFKSRGLSAAITRATAEGATSFVIPTAGNAGVAASAYGARAGVRVRVYTPETTPPAILTQITAFGGDLVLIRGHIGDCGRAAREWAASSKSFDISTLREPYRIEGKKVLGIELAQAGGWSLPQAIIYPTGGGTGLIGMWKAFQEMREWGWITGPLPRMYAVQSQGCAPIVAAFEEGRDTMTPWPDPVTVASGLRVPAPLGDRLILRAIRESGGAAVAVQDADLAETARVVAALEGVDLSPEGGATLAAVRQLVQRGMLQPEEKVVAFNTGAGWLYRQPAPLPAA